MRSCHLSVDQFLNYEELAINGSSKRLLSEFYDLWKKRFQESRFESERKLIFSKAWAEHRLKRKILYAWMNDIRSLHFDGNDFLPSKVFEPSSRRVSFHQNEFLDL
ncbi:hypothetical protein BC829DRAFT_52553 [Chytridium lagenaria]|nr:hypothetical protein BC829DRAFT_52553 [Chytridium lagenaria]